MANVSNYEGDDDIVEQYENQESDGEYGSLGEAGGEPYDNDDELETAQRIDPSKSKTHVVRNPIPKLNTERLKGPNGIQTIEKYFEGFKFNGKGYEKTDLDRIMKRLEHWSYRLFPKYHFDDFLTRVEQLGTKKDLQVFLKKYRLDMITSDNDVIIQDDTDDEGEQQESAPMDDLDLLITEQIQKQKQAEMEVSIPAPSTSNDDAFDQLLMQSNNISNSQEQHTTIAKDELNDGVKEKIERNKQLAIQRRLQRQKEREEEAKRSRLIENTSVETLNENSDSISHGETNASQIDCAQSQIDEIDEKEANFDKTEEILNEEQVTNHV
nr:PREDICTED: protein TIPIN homolog [Linepithema humile]